MQLETNDMKISKYDIFFIYFAPNLVHFYYIIFLE